MKYLLIMFISIGCASLSDTNVISKGMTKGQVIKELGTPASIQLKDDTEILNYEYCSHPLFLRIVMFGICVTYDNYYVGLKSDKVNQYRAEKFKSPRNDGININNTNINVEPKE